MPDRPTAPDSLVDAEIAGAESETSPERLCALDAAHELSPAQCLRVGEALARVAQARYDDESVDEDDPDDRLEERLMHAVALQILGGGSWSLEADYSRELVRGQTLAYRVAVGTLDGWAHGGWASLAEPAEVRLPWPEAPGRKAALRLAGELLPSLRRAADLEPALARAIERAMVASLEVDPLDAAGFARLREALRSEGRTRVDAGQAARAAEGANTDTALNRRAYQSHIVDLVFGASLAALEETPDFTCIFDARVKIAYPESALEEDLDRYYSSVAAGFDEIFNFDEDQQGDTASRLLHELLDEAARVVRQQRRLAAG